MNFYASDSRERARVERAREREEREAGNKVEVDRNSVKQIETMKRNVREKMEKQSVKDK